MLHISLKLAEFMKENKSIQLRYLHSMTDSKFRIHGDRYEVHAEKADQFTSNTCTCSDIASECIFPCISRNCKMLYLTVYILVNSRESETIQNISNSVKFLRGSDLVGELPPHLRKRANIAASDISSMDVSLLRQKWNSKSNDTGHKEYIV